MNNVIKKGLNRYQLFVLFVLFSIVLFFVIRLIAGMIYYTNVTNDILGQFTNAIDIVAKMIGAYLLLLSSMAVVGLLLSRTREKPEYVKGFKFSLVFCGILFGIYLILLLSMQ